MQRRIYLRHANKLPTVQLEVERHICSSQCYFYLFWWLNSCDWSSAAHSFSVKLSKFEAATAFIFKIKISLTVTRMSMACRHNLEITTLHPNFSSWIEAVLAFTFQLTGLWETALQTFITSLKKLSLNEKLEWKISTTTLVAHMVLFPILPFSFSL